MLFSFQRPQPSRAGFPKSQLQSRKKASPKRGPRAAAKRGPSQSTLRLGRIRFLQLPLGQRLSVAPKYGSLEALEPPGCRSGATPGGDYSEDARVRVRAGELP